MSRSERARIRNKRIPADDYFTNGVFEVARFGKDVILRNNRTPEQQLEHMEYLETQYTVQYEALLRKIREFHSSVLQCDPFKLLRHQEVVWKQFQRRCCLQFCILMGRSGMKR